MMVRFRNWNRLLLGPRSRDNYWDIQRRCEVWAFLLAILWWWGDMGWVRNRMAGPEIVKTLKYNFKRLTTKLWPTLTSHFFFQTSNSLRALISVGCCIHSMTCKYLCEVTTVMGCSVFPIPTFTRPCPALSSGLDLLPSSHGSISSYLSSYHFTAQNVAKSLFQIYRFSPELLAGVCLSFVLENIHFCNWDDSYKQTNTK